MFVCCWVLASRILQCCCWVATYIHHLQGTFATYTVWYRLCPTTRICIVVLLQFYCIAWTCFCASRTHVESVVCMYAFLMHLRCLWINVQTEYAELYAMQHRCHVSNSNVGFNPSAWMRNAFCRHSALSRVAACLWDWHKPHLACHRYEWESNAVKLCLHTDAGHSERCPWLKDCGYRVFSTETLISLRDISDKVASETTPDFACFDNTLASIAFH